MVHLRRPWNTVGSVTPPARMSPAYAWHQNRLPRFSAHPSTDLYHLSRFPQSRATNTIAVGTPTMTATPPPIDASGFVGTKCAMNANSATTAHGRRDKLCQWTFLCEGRIYGHRGMACRHAKYVTCFFDTNTTRRMRFCQAYRRYWA